METKICNTCKRELPATAQYFYRFIHSKDGFKSSCKECQGGKFIAKETIPKGYRKCHDCKQILLETEENFIKVFSKRDNLYYFKCHCRECGKIRSLKWRDKNKAQYLNYAKEYRATDKCRESRQRYLENHKEEVRAYKKAYRASHKEQIQLYDKQRRESQETREHILGMCRRWRANNVERVADYNKSYAANNLDYYRQATQKRAALAKSVESTLTLQEWENAKTYFDNSCAYCGKQLQRLTQDHFIPLSKGGTYTIRNIIPACKSCNCAKHDNNFNEWYKSYKFYSADREAKILEYIDNMAIPR